jgi:hypothetical protein
VRSQIGGEAPPQPIHKKTQAYKVIDVATGVLERGTWKVADAVNEQPWLPNGPIPLNVMWTLPGYTPGSVSSPTRVRGDAR